MKFRCFAAGLLLACGVVVAEPGIPALHAADAVDLTAGIGPDADVVHSALSPNGSTVVYSADPDGGSSAQLYAVSVNDGSTVRLDGITLPDRAVADFAISPDGQWVVYRADQNLDDMFELFTVPITGGTPVRVSAFLLNPGSDAFADYEFTPDSSRIVYRADRLINEGVELLSVAVTGGASASVSGPMNLEQTVLDFHVSGDGSRVVFRAKLDDPLVFELYSASLSGAGLVQLNSDHAVGAYGDVQDFEISPDSARVVFTMDREVTDQFKLYSAAIDTAGSAVLLTTAAGNARSVAPTFGFVISPDSARVVYRSDSAVDQAQLYSVPINDGPVKTLFAFGAAGSLNVDQLHPRFSPDGSQLLFRADTISAGFRRELYRVPLDGSAPAVKLSGPLVAGGGVSSVYDFSADGSRVVFMADDVVDDQTELLATTVTSGALARLSAPPADTGGDVTEVVLTPDGQRAVFVQDIDDDGNPDALSLVATAGGASVRLNPSSPSSADVADVMLTPDGQRIVFVSDPFQPELDRLLTLAVPSAPAGGGGGGGVGALGLGSFLVPVGPVRVFDSRPGQLPAAGPKGVVGPDDSVDVQVTGDVSGVPASAVAVVLNVTATDAVGPGYLTVFAAGQPRPLASALNLTTAGQVRPNAVVVPIGAGGMVSVYSQSGAHVVVDVTGYFEPTDAAVAGGRIESLAPTRLFDTRAEQPAPGPKGIVPSGGSIDVQVGGVAGVPNDAVAVVINVTATDTTAPGFVTVYGTGGSLPLASTLNVNFAGETVPNLVIMPIGAGGKITLYTQSATHLLGDVTGYVTGAGAAVDDSGLFVPLAPTRVFDTRPTESPVTEPKGFVAAGATITAQFTGRAGIPAEVGLVLMNVTAADAATGFITAYPHGHEQPLASVLNPNGPDDIRPNAAAIPIGDGGQIDFFTQSGAHLLADANGYTLP